ncbi:secretion/DNA translocation related TadE-like protein [Glaciihabitans tibetensis]|uniref:Secretion/DNA translocation related TadE-like protein n=1 Tax=Glaciihabitans tibetensis TaxID=1266600 RepID=A0A2T0V5B7_9MICO|nr:Rv3654c family TadE-like protein [Glaciihabitans tibetensis]PRY65389.1 secretion/DNA translocation related TadE-like protein [Glaciihabitans tibetensis]
MTERPPRRPDAARSSAGAASVLGIGVIASMLLVVAIVLPLYIGLSVRQSVIGATEAGALAAADVAVGRIPGVPCEAAEQIVRENGAELTGCVVEGVIVTVSASRTFLGLQLRAAATAGPPGSDEN